MSRVSKVNSTHVYVNGADDPFEVYLNETDAPTIYGVAAPAGWYAPSSTAETTVSEVTEEKIIRDESGKIVKRLITRREGMLKSTLLQTDTATIKLLRLLESKAHTFRYPLPVDGATQLFGMVDGHLKPGWELKGAEGAERTLVAEILSSKKDDNRAIEVEDVDMTDQSAWPPNMSPFLDVPA